MQEWPLKSKLDPEIYGPPESAITTEMIEEEIGGLMSVNKVSKMINYHIYKFHTGIAITRISLIYKYV